MNTVRVWFDAFHFPRQAFGHPWPVMGLAIRVLKDDVGVRIHDAGHAQVLVDALASALVLGLHPTGDFKPVLFHRPIG